MNLLNKLFGPAPQPQPKVAFPMGYTLDEFRDNAAMVGEAKTFFLRTQLGGHILSALHNAAPVGFPVRGPITDTVAAIELGRREGYNECLQTLYALTVSRPEQHEVPIDYGASEVPTDQL